MFGYATKKTITLVATAVMLAGCATPMQTMQLSQEELAKLSPNEGIVVGSVIIKGGKDVLGRTKWELVAENSDKSFSSGFEYSLQAHRGGKEEIFVAKMPAGNYRFWRLYQPGFSTFKFKTDINFQVQPGKTLYIGRLIVEFPQDTILTVFTNFTTSVEDAKETTVSAANDKLRIQLSDVATNLMVIK